MYFTEKELVLDSTQNLINSFLFVYSHTNQELSVLQNASLEEETLPFKMFKHHLENKILPDGMSTLKLDLDCNYLESVAESPELEIFGFVGVEDDYSLKNYEKLVIGENGLEIDLGGKNGKSFRKEVFNKFALYYS